MKHTFIVPILLLSIGILLVFGSVHSTNDGVWIGGTLIGLACMMCAVVCMIEDDDV